VSRSAEHAQTHFFELIPRNAGDCAPSRLTAFNRHSPMNGYAIRGSAGGDIVGIGENWKCPYCGHAQVIAEERFREGWDAQHVKGWKEKGFYPSVFVQAVVCANSDCRELTLTVLLGRLVANSGGKTINGIPYEWR